MMRIKIYFSRGRLVINKAKANRQIVYHILYENCSFEVGIDKITSLEGVAPVTSLVSG